MYNADAKLAALEAEEAREASIIAAMQEMASDHATFGRDGGASKDAVWINLCDTIVERGLVADWDPYWTHLERAFDTAWPDA